MMLHQRFISSVLICLAPLLNSTVYAQVWPAKPITIVVPFPPGGTTDVLARAIARKLGVAVGQSIIVDNKPGAGATLGAGLVAKSTPDGYTLLMGAVHHTIAPSVYKKLPYSFDKDFAPITTVAMVPNVLVMSAKAPFNNVHDLIEAAKTNPNKYSFGSNGNGTAQHLIGAQIQLTTGAKLLHVPYKGSGPMAIDLLAGQTDMSFDTITPVLPFIKNGKLKALAVTTAKRSPVLPNVPTMQEVDIPNLAIGTWFGLLAPAATPKDVIAKLSTELIKIIHSDDFKKQMLSIGAEPIGNTPAEMSKQIKDETEKFAALVNRAKISIE